MHMTVNKAGNDIIAISVENLVRVLQFLGYGSDLAVLYVDMPDNIATFIDKPAVFKEQRADSSSPQNGKRRCAVLFKFCDDERARLFLIWLGVWLECYL